MRNKTTTTITSANQAAILIPQNLADDLHKLLFQLSCLNDTMRDDGSNSIVNALLLSIDPANSDEIREALETISRINLSDAVIGQLMSVIREKGGAQ